MVSVIHYLFTTSYYKTKRCSRITPVFPYSIVAIPITLDSHNSLPQQVCSLPFSDCDRKASGFLGFYLNFQISRDVVEFLDNHSLLGF